jgi:hypothetical protein
MTPRSQKITLGEMRESGPTKLIAYCFNRKCNYHADSDASQWPDEVRISDLEERFVCMKCGERGADIRPLWPKTPMGVNTA